jgi:hypothetical protein
MFQVTAGKEITTYKPYYVATTPGYPMEKSFSPTVFFISVSLSLFSSSQCNKLLYNNCIKQLWYPLNDIPDYFCRYIFHLLKKLSLTISAIWNIPFSVPIDSILTPDHISNRYRISAVTVQFGSVLSASAPSTHSF